MSGIARLALVVAALLAAVGCDDGRSPTAPTPRTPPTGSSPPAPEPFTGTVTVTVQDFMKRPLAGVLVDVPSPSGPIASATTDAGGRCSLQVPPSATLRAQKDGYDPETLVLQPTWTSAFITSYRRAAAGELRGIYRLTVQPSPTCTALGMGANQLVYNARVETSDSWVFVLLGPTDRLVAWGGEPGFTGAREGNRISFVISDSLLDDGYSFIGRHPSLGDVYYQGTAVAEYGGGAILAAFKGQIRTSAATCQATDHRLELMPCSRDDWIY